MRIGIVGGGFVGRATALFECKGVETCVYELDDAKRSPSDTTKKDLLACDLVFVCVPTYKNSEYNTTIVERCVADLKELGVQHIVLRSTVPPGTSKRLDVACMPEFLTDVNWRSDFYNCDAWIIGIQRQTQVALFQRLLTLAATAGSIKRNRPVFVSRGEAEMIKYVRSNFFALKQAFFTEVHALCRAHELDYTTVRDGVAMDTRIGVSHTASSGSHGHLPKDTCSLFHIPIVNACHTDKTAFFSDKPVDLCTHDLESAYHTYTT